MCILQEQSRRDAELMRLKKSLLNVYYEEQGPCSKKRPRPACVLFDAVENMAMETPRPKYRRASLDAWKIACKNARDTNDAELPSLEEASLLFGYGASN